MEVWKRKSAELAHQWDVVNYEALEPNRPEFQGSKQYEVSFLFAFLFLSFSITICKAFEDFLS